MTGNIKFYNEQKWYGFIIGEDRSDYFFHVSSLKNTTNVYCGQAVNFSPSKNSKGKCAKNVVVNQKLQNTPSFIQFGNTQIKVKNIKNFGISKTTGLFAAVYCI